MQLTGSSDSEDQLRRGDKQDPRRRRSSPPDRHAGHRRQTPPEATAPTSQQEGHRKDESDTPEGKPTNKVHAATKPSLATVVVAAQATTRNPHRCPDIHHALDAIRSEPPPHALQPRGRARIHLPGHRATLPIHHEPAAQGWLRKLQGDASNKVATRPSPPPAPDGA